MIDVRGQLGPAPGNGVRDTVCFEHVGENLLVPGVVGDGAR